MFKSGTPGSRSETFEAIALSHFDTVYNVAMAFTWNLDEAQDLVQETYYRATAFGTTRDSGHMCRPGCSPF